MLFMRMNNDKFINVDTIQEVTTRQVYINQYAVVLIMANGAEYILTTSLDYEAARIIQNKVIAKLSCDLSLYNAITAEWLID